MKAAFCHTDYALGFSDQAGGPRRQGRSGGQKIERYKLSGVKSRSLALLFSRISFKYLPQVCCISLFKGCMNRDDAVEGVHKNNSWVLLPIDVTKLT